MKRLEPNDIAHYSKQSLISLAVDLSDTIDSAIQHNRLLEQQIKRLAEELGAKNQKVLFAAEALGRLQSKVFGPSSEKSCYDQDMFSQVETCEPIPVDTQDETPTPKKPRKPRTRFGRTPQPGLQKQEVIFRYGDAGDHGLIVWEDQFEISEMIHFVPSQFILQVLKRQKYFKLCPHTGQKQIVTAPGPLKLKENSRYSPEFAIEVGLNKYLWHQPLERQVAMFASYGLNVKSQTLFEQIDLISWYLKPVFRKIIEFIHSKPVNEADDTTWKNLGPKGDGDPQKFYLWAVLNDQAACFNVYNARNQKVAKNFLGQLEGYLVTDGHNSFKALGGINSKLILANDWCHARRRFKEASKNYGPEAKAFLAAINRLFAIEDEIRDGPPADRHQVRQEKSKPVVEAIRKLLDETACLPQSSLGRAIAYTDQLWEGLTVFLSDPRVPIHTNSVERALRSPAIGRKNHLGSKNLVTASVAAIWYSVITTCKLNGVEPRDYLTETIRNILSKKPYLMPWEWAATKS